jgi:hypothetical protein
LYFVLYSKGLKAKPGESRKEKKIPVGARFSALVQIGPGAHPASFKMGTESLSLG